MVIDRGQRSAKKPVKQGVGEDTREPIKIGASTPYDFDSKNLTAFVDCYRWRPCSRNCSFSSWSKKPSP